MTPVMGLRRISVRSKRCLRNSGSCRSPSTRSALVHRDFHAVEAEVVLPARIRAARAHVVEIRLDVAAEDARVVRDQERALDEARLDRLEVVEVVLFLRVE